MSILETIVKAKFLADEKQVEALAGVVGEGINASGTYLSVVIAHTQEGLHHKRKPSVESQLSIVDDVHKRFYECVLRGVGPPEMEDAERNRRATFARSAASDLRYFIRKGGDVRALDAATVSKAKLRAEGKTVPTGTRAERSLSKAAAAFERSIKSLARKDADAAGDRITDIVERSVKTLAGVNVEAARAEVLEMQTRLETLLQEIGRPAPVARKAPKKAASKRDGTRAEHRAH